jgi:predicted NAD/FAD-binding protein
MTSGRKVAVVGAGAAGIYAAHILSRNNDVTLFEKAPTIGGHVHTVTVPSGPDAGLPVDMGFIVHNDRTYPIFMKFLEELGVPFARSDMSFSFYDRSTGFMYSGTGLNGLFADRRNILSPSFWRMLKDIYSFCSRAKADLAKGDFGALTLGEYLKKHKLSGVMKERYLAPMTRAIWSSGDGDVDTFPVENFVRFFHNHGLLTVIYDKPQWRYIPGGSRSYVDAFLKQFSGRVETNSPVAAVSRHEDEVRLQVDGKGEAVFDELVLACHADEALMMLTDPSPVEVAALTPWKFVENEVVLHTDEGFLPPLKRAWASWNYILEPGDEDSRVNVHYLMNRLQCLDTRTSYVVTLNPRRPVAEDKVIESVRFSHPQFSLDAVRSREELKKHQGEQHTWYCGAWMDNGFHEDAVRSAAAVGSRFGE